MQRSRRSPDDTTAPRSLRSLPPRAAASWGGPAGGSDEPSARYPATRPRRARRAGLRARRTADTACDARMTVDGREIVGFASNDYLGLAAHPALVAAFAEGAQRYGSGSGGSHLLGGHSRAHATLEDELAAFSGGFSDAARAVLQHRLHGEPRRDDGAHRQRRDDLLGRAEPRVADRRHGCRARPCRSIRTRPRSPHCSTHRMPKRN